MENALIKINDWSGGNKLSVMDNPREFSEVILKSPPASSKIVKAVIEEIRSEETPLTKKQWLAFSSLFCLIFFIGIMLWPSRPTPVDDNMPDIKVKITKGETEEYLYDELGGNLLKDEEWEVALKKLRLLVVDRKDVVKYKEDYNKYYSKLCEWGPKHPESRLIKRFIVEAVLKYMNGSQLVGIETYARHLKNFGDKEYDTKDKHLNKAIDCCNEILNKMCDDDDRVRYSFQKAELLMYKWLVLNAQTTNGQKIKKIPDDAGDKGVWEREEALRIIRESALNAKNARELVRQCIRILIDNSSTCNRIRFNNDVFIRHTALEREEARIFKSGR